MRHRIKGYRKIDQLDCCKLVLMNHEKDRTEISTCEYSLDWMGRDDQMNKSLNKNKNQSWEKPERKFNLRLFLEGALEMQGPDWGLLCAARVAINLKDNAMPHIWFYPSGTGTCDQESSPHHYCQYHHSSLVCANGRWSSKCAMMQRI